MKTRIPTILAFALMAMVLAASPGARAEGGATVRARQYYQDAQKQFELGNWEAASTGFAKAYELRPDPSLLYDMAQAYRRGGNLRRAIDLYKNFLIKAPKSPQRADVEERIQSLQKQLDEETLEGRRATAAPQVAPAGGELSPPAATAPPANPPASPEGAGTEAQGAATETPGAESPQDSPAPAVAEPPSEAAVAPPAPSDLASPTAKPPIAALGAAPRPALPEGSRRLRVAGIVVGSAGLAAAAGGLVFTLRTRSLSNAVSSAPKFNANDAQSGKRAELLQWIGYGAAAALVPTGVLLYVKGRPGKGDVVRVALAPAFGADGAGVAAMGAF